MDVSHSYQDEVLERRGGFFDPYPLVATIRRNLGLLIGVMAGMLLLSAIATLFIKPRYAATAEVLLDARKQNISGITDVLSGLPVDTTVVDTEVEVLRSRDFAEQVVSKLNLDKDPEFNAALGQESRGASPATLKRHHEKVVNNVISRLSVKRSGLTNIIDIGFTSANADKAARLANAFSALYVHDQLERKKDATVSANEWLTRHVDELRGQVDAAEGAVAQYKSENGLLNAGDRSLTEEEISKLDEQLAQVEVQRTEAEARLDAARQQLRLGNSGEGLGEALGSETISRLRQQSAVLSGNLADLESIYGPQFPEILRAKKQMADINLQIEAETKRIVENLATQASIQQQRTASLQASVAALKGRLITDNNATVRLRELEINAESVRTIYESFLSRLRQTSAQQGEEQSDSRVISWAKSPVSPRWPSLRINLAIGLLMGLGCGAGVIVLREAFDTSIRTLDEFEDVFDISYLAGIPKLRTKLLPNNRTVAPIRYLVEKPTSRFADAFRNLRASLRLEKSAELMKVIAITSALPDEGKTTTSICLARTMAMAGDKVIVVDCDLAKRGVSRACQTAPRAGLLEVLSGTASLADAVVRDELTKVVMLPVLEGAYTPEDALGGLAMTRLLSDLKARFDVVILDTPPVLPVAETRSIAAKADIVVVVTKWRATPRKATLAALRLLRSENIAIVGGALTQIDMKEQAKSGYGDPAYYYTKYGDVMDGDGDLIPAWSWSLPKIGSAILKKPASTRVAG